MEAINDLTDKAENLVDKIKKEYEDLIDIV